MHNTGYLKLIFSLKFYKNYNIFDFLLNIFMLNPWILAYTWYLSISMDLAWKIREKKSPPWRAVFLLYLGDFYTKIYYKSRGFTCSPPQARKFWGFSIKVRKFSSFFGISENIFGWVLFQNLKIRKYFRWVLFQIFEIRKDFEKKSDNPRKKTLPVT